MSYSLQQYLTDFMVNECGLKRVCSVLYLVNFILMNAAAIRKETQVQKETLKRLQELKRNRVRVPFTRLEKEIVAIILLFCARMTSPMIKGVNKLMAMLGYSVYTLRPLRARQHIENLKRCSSRLNEMKRKYCTLNLETGYDTNGVTPLPPRYLADCSGSSENQDHEEQFDNRCIIRAPDITDQGLTEEQLRVTGLENFNDNKFSTEAINYESCVGVEIPNRDLNY